MTRKQWLRQLEIARGVSSRLSSVVRLVGWRATQVAVAIAVVTSLFVGSTVVGPTNGGHETVAAASSATIDYAWTNRSTNNLKAKLSNGTILTDLTSGEAVKGVGGIADYDGDNQFEIAYTTDADGSVKFVDKNGNIEDSGVGGDKNYLGGAGDVDGDGLYEVAYDAGGTLKFVDVNGEINSTGVSVATVGGVGDWDGDGDLDVAGTEPTSDDLFVTDLAGNRQEVLTGTGGWVGGMADWDGDGNPEVAYANSSDEPTVIDANGEITGGPQYENGMGGFHDVDGDGSLELFYIGDSFSRQYLESDGTEATLSSNSAGRVSTGKTGTLGVSEDLKGTVRDQSGAAVANATVELWLMDDANTTTDAGETVEDAQEETIETISRSVPRDLYDPDVDLVKGATYANTAEKQVLVHPVNAWYDEATPLSFNDPAPGGTVGAGLGSPMLQIEPNTPYAVSIWDRTKQPVLEDGVDEKINPGVSSSGTVVVEQVGPGNDTVDRFTENTTDQVRAGSGPGFIVKKHEYSEVSLPEGYYRLRAQNGTVVTILRVGSPEQIPRRIRPDLDNAENQTSAIASEVNNKLDNGEMKRVTVSTNETGYFNYSSVPSGTSTVAITVFDGQGLTDGISDPTVSDLQTQIDRQDYNGSITLSTSPEIVNPPDRNVSITVTEVNNPSLGDLAGYFDQLSWVRDLVNEEAFAGLSHLFTEPLDSTPKEDLLESRNKLRDTVLANEDMRAAWEEIAAERGIETDLFASDLSKAELKEQLDALLLATSRGQNTIPTDEPTVDTSPITGGGTNVNVNVELDETVNKTGNATNVVCQQPNGSTRWVNQDNVSVDNGLTGSEIQIQETLANSTAACNYVITAPGEDGGTARETVNVKNPAFEGEVPELDSINLNTQRPGPDEEVRVDVTPSETSSFQSLQGATVYGPDGSEINSSISSGVVSFRTAGAGSHLIKLNVTDGERSYVESIRVKGGESSVNYPASVRVHNGVLGRTVVASDGVEAGRISVEDGGSSARITAEVPEGDVPGSIHVHARDLTGTDQELTVAVVSAEDGSRVTPATQIKLHVPRLEDDAHVRVNGHPITEEGTKWGKRESFSDSSLITTNLRDGTVSASINNNPSLIDEIAWRGALLAERLPFAITTPVRVLELGAIDPAVSIQEVIGA